MQLQMGEQYPSGLILIYKFLATGICLGLNLLINSPPSDF